MFNLSDFFQGAVDDKRYRPIEGGIATIRYPNDFVGTLGIIIKKVLNYTD